MADFNALVASRFAELIRRLLGEEINVTGVSPEIGISLELESDRVEWCVHKGETPWFGNVSQAALVGNFSLIQGSVDAPNAISIVTKLLIVNLTAAATQYKYGWVLTAAGATGLVGSRDLRVGSGSAPHMRLAITTQAGDPFPANPTFVCPASSMIQLPIEPFVIGVKPNGQFSIFTISGGVVNQAVTAFLWGYDRALRDEERAFGP